MIYNYGFFFKIHRNNYYFCSMKRIIIISLVVISVVVATIVVIKYLSNMNSNYITLNANEFEAAIADNQTIILDVRTSDEYIGGHIPNAINIDVNRAGFLYEADEKLTKDKTIAVYCHGGVRSRKAASLLCSRGFSVINLDGGITEWRNAGKETTVE